MNAPRVLVCSLFALLVLLTGPGPTHAESWKLPAKLDDSNTTVTFVVDSTWHTVQGSTKGVTGDVILRDPKDPLSIVATIKFPVRLFNTDGESRDEKLQKVMASGLFPDVTFTSSRLSPSCAPKLLSATGRCEGALHGTLRIRDVQRQVDLPILIAEEGEQFVMEGSLPIQWADFNVEDPSILIAKLDPTVTITYRTVIPIYR